MDSWLEFGLKMAPYLIEGVKFLFSDEDNKSNNNDYEEKLSRHLEELKQEKIEMERKNKENEAKIMELERNMKESILKERERMEMEKEKELREKERIEQEKKIEENKRRQEAISKCKESLSSAYTQGILKAIKKFHFEEEKWLDSLSDKNIQMKLNFMKKKLNSLFLELFENEKILEKMKNKFLNILENTSFNKELETMNFMIIGPSGVGKSTLINELYGEYLAEEGSGKKCTTKGKKYISDKIPFMSLIDTVGAEIGKEHTLEDVEKDTLNEITKNLNINNPNEHIHCIIYCTTSNRIFEDELKVILKIREKYDGKKLPIVIAYTRALDENEVESKKKAIKEFLNNYGEEISDDIFGISFIKILAKEYIIEKRGQKICDPCSGLADLVETCYKKGEKSYKIAIKNSLVEIAKNSFYNYIREISNSLVNNINFFLYLSQKFDPNFLDFISFCFDKFSDIENQSGLNEKELKDLENLVEEKTPNKEEHFSGFNDDNSSDSKSDESSCMFCHNIPKNPFSCEYCGAKACELCYYGQFEYRDKVICLVCNKDNFNMEDESSNKINKIKEDNSENHNDNGNNNNIPNEKYITNFNVLENNLNMQSRNLIKNYVEEFRHEMLQVFDQKFEEFSESAVQSLYYDLLEKYNENISKNGNININEAMKNKEELKSEAANTLKNQLKGPSEEKFLKKHASYLFQDIVKIFELEMANKIKQFIGNLNSNKDVNNFFDSNEFLKNEENLKIETNFREYIKSLKQKEILSQEKALKLQYGDSMNENSGYSESIHYGESKNESKVEGESKNEIKEEESSLPYSSGY